MKYQIVVQGNIDSSWSDWFDGMGVSTAPGRSGDCVTTLSGPVEDQATLRGVLNHLWDLNLTILAVTRIEAEG
jgi:hypothetical protein